MSRFSKRGTTSEDYSVDYCTDCSNYATYCECRKKNTSLQYQVKPYSYYITVGRKTKPARSK
jgi:hypothetical protein